LLLYRSFAKVILGEIEMSKKNVLNEVRRFMTLANLDASLASNFVTKLEEMEKAYMRDDEEEMMQEEEEEEAEEEVELEMPEDEEGEEMDDMEAMDDVEDMMDMEDEEEADEAVLTDDEADAIIALADKLRAARDDMGGEEMEMDVEMGEEEMMEETAEETLEEILDDVLSEEETLEEEEEIEEGVHGGNKDDKSKTHRGEDYTTKKGDTLKRKAYMQEEVVQEVLRRVKARLTEMAKAKE
jgi:hypothetical protein